MREWPPDMLTSALVAEVAAHGVRSMRGDELTAEDWARYREVETGEACGPTPKTPSVPPGKCGKETEP